MSGMSVIVKTITRLLVGFLVLFGIYLFLHGHRSHGVGFAGGVIIALAFMQFMIAFGKDAALKKMNETAASLYLNLSFLALFILSVAGIFYGHTLLAPPRPDGLFGSPMLLLANAALCLTAGGSLFFMFLNLVSFKNDKEKK